MYIAFLKENLKKKTHSLITIFIFYYFFQVAIERQSCKDQLTGTGGKHLSHSVLNTGPNGDVTHTQANSSFKSSLQWLPAVWALRSVPGPRCQ